jgi:protease-4
MPRIAVAVLVALTLSGCRIPLHVQTCGHVGVSAPGGFQSHVVTETAPVSLGGPIQQMPLSGGGCPAGPRIAIVDVDGILLNINMTGPYSLGENPLALFREKLDAAAADPAIAALVVRINSPGGGVTPSDIMWRDLRAFKECTGRPVVACLMDVGAGGAYYLACAADRIIAHPTSVTGGIGVILNLYNLRDAMAYFNVLSQAIKSGVLIDMGSPTGPLPPEARKLLQGMADEFHNRFRQVVVQARPRVDGADDTLFDGRVFTAGQAQERGLIDGVGYLDDALAQARALASVEKAAAVVLLHRDNDPARSLYAQTPNQPLGGSSLVMPVSVPGLERSRLPTFLYMWQPEATLERVGSR